MTGVKQDDWGTVCWVVAIGDKDKNTSFNKHNLELAEEIMSEMILLDNVPEESFDSVYKKKNFRCMRPKGLPLLKKAKKDVKERTNTSKES